MKLLTKTSIHYLWLSFAILFISGGALFLTLKMNISNEIREQLELDTDLIANEIAEGKTIYYPMADVQKLSSKQNTKPAFFKDTVIFDPRQGIKENYYLLTEERVINGNLFRIKVLTTYIGWDEYLTTITSVFAIILFLLLVAGFAINYFLNQKLLHPFLTNIERLKSHSLKSSEQLVLEHSNIEEFKQLNSVLSDYNRRATKQYHELKEFSENASHELQTPITIIRTRLESLSQLTLEQDAALFLQDAKSALDRLRRVNKGLLLLAKLSNQQFNDIELVSVSGILTSQVEILSELFQSKNLELDMQVDEVFQKANVMLTEILFSNLLSNMLKYSVQGKTVNIELNQNQMVFTNPGPPLPFNETELFKRFQKTENGIGLGLAIVEQICRFHGWRITYSFKQFNLHQFMIFFK